MADFLIQATLSNLVVATSLAVIAWVVQRRVRSASLANLLWALVLIKMVTPPLFSLPVFAVPSVSSLSVQPAESAGEFAPPMVDLTSSMDRRALDLKENSTLSGKTEIVKGDAPGPSFSAENRARILAFAFALSLVISAILLVVSVFRIIRFHWLLKANSRVHHDLSNGLSADVASQLGLRKNPDIVVTTANIAPFVWWMAGRSVIVVSQQATQKLNEKDLWLVITHEMAHIKRRDHWLRWLEWVALIVLWWNPVMWWARQQLRISEEMACDDLVLETAAPEVHQYANSLLNMAELLASSAIRPPVVASAINSGGNLEKRLKMIIADKTWKVPSALRMAILAVATCVFPLGVVYAQDFEAVERRLGGAVEAGELTLEQANLMLQALRRSNMTREMEVKRRYMAAAEQIKAAVEAGEVSEEVAEKRLIEMRKAMFGGDDKSDKTDDREMEGKKWRYMEFTREIEAAVKAGKLSKKDAEKKLIAVRKAMFRNPGKKKERGGDRDMEGRKKRYDELQRAIKTAVERGEMNPARAEKKLIELRREIFERDNDRTRNRPDVEKRSQNTSNEAGYKRLVAEAARKIEAFEAELNKDVQSGKLSKEEFKNKLLEYSNKVFAEIRR